ncbi:MAG: hypothetical protein ACRC46_14290 [Thermoguttaceae bacterium]
MLTDIFKKVDARIDLTKDDAICLLNVVNGSHGYFALLDKANELSHAEYGRRGYLFAQIGINAAPCSGNCKFCSMAKDNFVVDKVVEKSLDEVVEQVKSMDFSKIAALFLMTTADFDSQKFLTIGEAVRRQLPERVGLVANVGDFSLDYARKLKVAGFTGAYHIVRLREQTDTALNRDLRIQTLDHIKEAELELYYCVEPIGQEHTYDEIVDEMLRARDYGVNIMAVMRRVGVAGTAFTPQMEINDIEFTKIAAVTRLVTRPTKSMNVHEPITMATLAGVNQFYAEIGVNPRDTSHHTENSRGFDIATVERMLLAAGYEL